MRKTFVFLLLMTGLCGVGRTQDMVMTQKQIKVGNSLREAQQFDNSEEYLLRGLANAQHLHSQYWEAVADEYLGLLYRDLKQETNSSRYLNNALRLYTAIGMSLSARVVRDILDEVSERGAGIYGGVEIGAKGVKFSVVGAWLSNGGLSFQSLRSGTNNVGVISLTDNAIHDAAMVVRAFMDTLEHNSTPIPDNQIFIAVSSGVKQELDRHPGTEVKLLNAIAAVAPGKSIGILTPGMEAKLTIKGIVPSNYLLRSTTMDIGSGNTKGGYFTSRTEFDSLSIPWGTGTLANKLNGKSDVPGYARQFFNDSIRNNPNNPLTEELQRRSAFLDRRYAFFSGGIVWVLVTYLYPEKAKEDVVEFREGDVDRFLQLVSTDAEKLRNPDLTKITDEAVMQAANTDIAGTRQFNTTQLIAGAVILKGIMAEMNRVAPKKNFYFLRNGVTGWITGYIVNQIAEGYSAKTD